MRLITDSSRIFELVARVKTVATSPVGINSDWLNSSGNLALVETSVGRFDLPQMPRLARALATLNVSRIVGIVNDDIEAVPGGLVYEFDATPEGIDEFDLEFTGLNAVLLPDVGLAFSAICTVEDFHIIAGPEGFLREYAWDPESDTSLQTIRSDFDEQFSREAFHSTAALQARKLMAWID